MLPANPFRKVWILLTIVATSCLVTIMDPTLLVAEEPLLVFSVKTWKGEYATKDVPGGVESTPTVGSIYTINADGSGLKKIVAANTSCDYPVASPDGRWVY